MVKYGHFFTKKIVRNKNMFIYVFELEVCSRDLQNQRSLKHVRDHKIFLL
jgi:hypothetical protein